MQIAAYHICDAGKQLVQSNCEAETAVSKYSMPSFEVGSLVKHIHSRQFQPATSRKSKKVTACQFGIPETRKQTMIENYGGAMM
jgi:hypothetical protein